MVPPELLSLRGRFGSEARFHGPITESMRAEVKLGLDAIAEACVVQNGRIVDAHVNNPH
ncbi:hypothetical protein [Pendulispora albinea]|uniref:Uncharacterized protein n=1 Tax=Pendulispora albinea TaxID=2741071 RepID=A0ABZ2LSJ1_9BACT